MSGVAAGRHDQLDWAIAAAKRGLDDVSDQGLLPREAARGARALAYHNFALEALVVVAEVAAANGEDLYGYRDEALRRLADFVIRNAGDPVEAAEVAGVPQSWTGPTSGRFVWAEPYYRRFQDPRLKDLLLRLRPMRHAFFGGNATLMYGLPLGG
jgi:poly(beta-D-mannuronate) lyase